MFILLPLDEDGNQQLRPQERRPSALPGARKTLRRTQITRTRNAIQKVAASVAMTMKFTGETSHEVSETMRPKANPEKSMARKNSQFQPCNDRFVRASACASRSGGRTVAGCCRRGFTSRS